MWKWLRYYCIYSYNGCMKGITVWRILWNQRAWVWCFMNIFCYETYLGSERCTGWHAYCIFTMPARDSGQTTQISVTLFINELASSYVLCTYLAGAILNIENILQAEYWGKPNMFHFWWVRNIGQINFFRHTALKYLF